MIVRPVNNFEQNRKKLPLELQIRVEGLVTRMQHLALDLCELPAPFQDIGIDLDGGTSLRFILFVREKTLYVLLET